MTAQENVVLVQSLLDRYNTHQSDPMWLEKGMAAYAANSTFTNVPLGVTLPGPEGYKLLVLFFAEGFPESSVEITNIVATEDQAIVEYTGRGTNTGPLHLPGGDVPATGRSAELQFCDVLRMSNGKIVSHRSYYDTMTLLQQLGLVPAMG